MNREDQIVTLRPLIPHIIEEKATSIAEQFQNNSLRPILKLQNQLLLRIFEQYIKKRKGVFYQLAYEKQAAYIQQSIQKDAPLRNFLIGSICGLFTIEEWQIYQQHEGELRKRLLQLLIVRLQSQIDHLSETQKR
jgi:hypothetical protein